MPASDGAGKAATGCHRYSLPSFFNGSLRRWASPLDGEVPISPRNKVKPSPALISQGQLVADLRIGDHQDLIGDIGDLQAILLKSQLLIGQFRSKGISYLSQFNERPFEPDVLLQKRLVDGYLVNDVIGDRGKVHPDLRTVLGDTGLKILLDDLHVGFGYILLPHRSLDLLRGLGDL